MTQHEFEERYGHVVVHEDYLALEQLYYLLDLDKDAFAGIVKAAGLDLLLKRRGRWAYLQNAEETYALIGRRQRARERLEALDRAHHKLSIERCEIESEQRELTTMLEKTKFIAQEGAI
jgi:hypothetical protein